MAKKTNQSMTPEQLQNEEVMSAFEAIVEDSLLILTPFEAAKYRTVITVDHSENEKYPNLMKEAVSYFWNLTLSKSKTGNLIIYFTTDKESVEKFGTAIFNRTLRSIFKHTTDKGQGMNIQDAVRISTDCKELHNFFYKRFVDGESSTVSIRALDHVKN